MCKMCYTKDSSKFKITDDDNIKLCYLLKIVNVATTIENVLSTAR